MSIYAPGHLAGRKLTTKTLRDTTGIFVAPQHIEARRENAKGKFLQFVPGHGGDVIAVTHKWGIAVYDLQEVQFEKPARLNHSREPRKVKKHKMYQYQHTEDSPILSAGTWPQLKRLLPEKIYPGNIETIDLQKPYRR